MAYLKCRVSGVPKVRRDGAKARRVRKDFPDNRDGIDKKNRFVAELSDVTTKYFVRYSVNGRIVSSPMLPTKKDAQVALVKVEADRYSGALIDPALGRDTFGSYAETWLEHRPLSPRTRDLYRGYLSNHILPTFEKTSLLAITPTEVRQWFGKVAIDAKGKEHPSTRAGAYGLMRSIMNTAVEDRVIAMTPCTVKGGSQERASGAPDCHCVRSSCPGRCYA